MAERRGLTSADCGWRLNGKCRFVVKLDVIGLNGHAAIWGIGFPHSPHYLCPVVGESQCPCDAVAPRYDHGSCRLLVGGVAVRRFSRNAWNQMEVLKLFELHGWPARVDSPFSKTCNPKQMSLIKTTAFRLTHGQDPLLIRFRGHSIDLAVSWEFNTD
jgi:hypothetical protein